MRKVLEAMSISCLVSVLIDRRFDRQVTLKICSEKEKKDDNKKGS